MKNVSIWHCWGLMVIGLLLGVVCVAFNSLLPLIVVAGILIASLIIWQPLLGFCMMAFYMPQENLILLFPSFTLIKLIGILTLGGWLVHLLLGKKVFKMNSFFILLILYLLWCLFSVTWAMQPEQSLQRIISMGQLLLMFILGYNLVDSKKELYLILGSYIIGALFASCLGIYNGYVYEFKVRIDSGNLQEPNFYARLIGLGVLFCAYFMFAFKNFAIRLLSFISCIIIMFAVLLSGSRGAWLALFVTFIAGLVFISPQIIKFLSKNRFAVVSSLIIICFVVMLCPYIISQLPDVIVQRAYTFTHISDQLDRAAGRLDIWLVGLDIAKDNIIKGVGIDNFPYAFTEYVPGTEGINRLIGLNRDSHNIYLANLTELGIPGFLLFLYLLFSMWRLGNRAETRADFILCKLLVVFWVISGLTSTDHYRKIFWLSMLIPSIMAQFGIFTGMQKGNGKIKTLFLSSIFPNRYNPNSGIFCFRLVQNLKAAGISVNVVAPVPYAPPFLWFKEKWRKMALIPWKKCIDGVEVIYPRFFCLPGIKFIKWNMMFMFWAVYPVINIMNNSAVFNIIHSYGVLPAGFVGQLSAKRLNLLSVCTAIGSDINVVAKSSEKMFSRAKYVLENAGQVISVGENLASEIKKHDMTNRNIKVIYQGVDSQAFDTTNIDPVQAKIKLGFMPGDRIILFVGNLVRVKGIYELTEAFAQISQKFLDAKLVIVGTGEEKNALIDLAHKKGLQRKIIFAGQIQHEELVWWYAASEIVVLLSYHEGVPNVIKEAMSCGRPVVATRTIGISELVDDGKSGILVHPGSINDAVAALEKLLGDSRLKRKMGEYARQLILKGMPNWQQTAEAYRKVYVQLIEGNG